MNESRAEFSMGRNGIGGESLSLGFIVGRNVQKTNRMEVGANLPFINTRKVVTNDVRANGKKKELKQLNRFN